MRYGLTCALIAGLSLPTASQTPRKTPQPPAPYQRGTDTAPVSVTLLKTGRSNTEAAQDTERAKARDRAERWTIGLTVFLVLGTLLQFGALLYQSHWLRRTVAITGEAVDISRKEFVATFRPRLKIRRVSLQETTGLGGLESFGSIQYILANVGGSPATIIEGRTVHKLIVKGTRLPPVPPYDDPEDSRDMDSGVVLTSGASMPNIHHGDISILPSLADVFMEHNDLFFFGYVEYADDNGVPRRIAFCRRVDPDGRFVVVETEPDYEYAE